MTTNTQNEKRCNGLTKKGTQCKFKCLHGNDYCGKHCKEKSSQRMSTPILSEKIENSIINLKDYHKLDLKKIRVKQLKITLNHYKICEKGKKKELLGKLQQFYNVWKPFIEKDYLVKKIQIKFRKYIKDTIFDLSGKSKYSILDSMNDTDIYTLDNLVNIPNEFIFMYQNEKNNIFTFDIRSLNQLLNSQSNQLKIQNPYTRDLFGETEINRIKRLIKYLKLQGFYLEFETLEDNPIYSTKRRIIKIFQEMDSLDQYTDPSWFLDLNMYQLKEFYKQTEDVWNWRLNLPRETKINIFPPTGRVFKINPLEVTKINNFEKLQQICLEFMEKLIYTANDRNFRITGSITILLGLVIVNKKAAEALPDYASMVSISDNNQNYNSEYYDLQV